MKDPPFRSALEAHGLQVSVLGESGKGTSSGMIAIRRKVPDEVTFTERIRQRVVTRDRMVQHRTIPERCVWWLASVSALQTNYVLNRMVIAWVDDSEEQDREVFKRILAREERDPERAIADSFELRVCRECWRLVNDRALVWFEDEPPSCHEPGRGTAVAPPVAHYKEERFVP